MAQGEKFKPKGVQTRGAIKELVSPSQMGQAGKVDFEQSESEAAAGFWTRRLVADPPGGFIFHCHCGFKRRVTGEEVNFFCERGGWVEGKTECDIQWTRMRKATGEIDEDGGDVMEEITTTETIEVKDEFTGRPRKVKIDVPIFEGRRVGEVKREEQMKRRAAGQPEQANPSNVIVQRTVKTVNEGETPADRVARKDDKK